MTKLPRPAYELWKLPRKAKKEFKKKYGCARYTEYKKYVRDWMKHKCSYYAPDYNINPMQDIFDNIYKKISLL